MVAIGQQSTDKVANLFYGFWSHVEVVETPTTTPTSFYLGHIAEAVLEVTREDTEFLGTTFPQRVEVIIPQRAGMRFTGQMSELHRRNLNLLFGNLPSSANNYLYPGANCPDESKFVRLVARRKRCDGFVMETLIWKINPGGLVQIGGDTTAVGTPIDLAGLDDSNGDFGGSEEAPLGYVYAPDPVTGP